MFQQNFERVTQEPTALAQSTMIWKLVAATEGRDSQKSPPRADFWECCEQTVDLPVPQDVSKFSKRQAVFMTGDVECFGSIQD